MSGSVDYLPVSPPPDSPPPSANRAWILGAVVALLVAVVCAVALFREGSAPTGLPPATRSEIFVRTLQDLRDFCGPGHPDSLDDHCHELAAFVARFPECRGDCVELARRELTPRPTR